MEYEATVDYNSENDRFYFSLVDEDGEDLVTRERLVAQETLFADLHDAALPSETLTLIDETGQTHEVNLATINDSIFISIDNRFTGEMDPNNHSSGYFNPDGDDANMDFSVEETFEDADNDTDDSIDDDSELQEGGGE
nr:hypothetical protein [Secundilactobacillus kimchicus]